MVAILYPRRLRNQLDVTQPGGIGLPDQGVPVLYSSNSFFVIETHGGGTGGGGSFSLGASNLGNTLGQTGVTGSRIVLAGIGNLTLSQLTDANGGTISISGGTAGAGFSAGVSGGNTAGATGATGTRLVFAGGQSITLSQATDANGGTITVSGASTAPQTVQTQNVHNFTLDGNTAGALAEVSSGTLTLAGGNGITLSQNGNAITVSGNTFSQSVQPETQTFVGGISASNTLYTSGTVRMSGAGNITVASSTGQLVLISGSQSVQTQNLHNVTLSGNTAGALAAISSGTLTLAGGNNITLSQAGNAVTISGAAAGGAQTAISGIAASNTTYTSGTVTFTGVGGGVTVSSNTGQRIDISVAAPVAQTNQAGSVYAVGNTTSSTSGTYDARTLSLRGDGIISIAATNSGFRISATQSAQTQNLHNVTISGNTSGALAAISSGTMTLAGGNNVTLSQAGNAVTISAASQTVQTQNMVAVTLSGNTSGAQALVSSGTLTLAGGNNITVSQAGNAVTISGANVGGAQTGISGIIGSDATYTSGTVQFTGSNMVTVKSSAGQRVVIDATQSVQPGVQNFVVSNTTFSSGTVSISGFGDVTVNTAANMIRISAPTQTAETAISGIANSQTTYTSGTVSLSELGAITIRSTTGNQFQFSVNSQTLQTSNVHNVTLSGNTSGVMAQVSSGTMTLAGGNNITLSQAGNAITISGANVGGAQTGISGIANSQTTYTSGTVSMSELGAITIRSTTGNQYQFSVNAQSVQPETQTFLGGLVASNTTWTSGTISISGFGDVTVNTAANLIRISAPVQTAQTGISGLANSQTTYTSGTVSLSELGAITIRSTTGNQYQFSVNSQTVQAGSVYAVGNTYSTSSGTYDARTLSIRGDGIISVAASNSGWRISASQSVQAETQTFVGGLAGSNTTYTSGTVTITGVGGGVTVSSNTGQRIDISVAAPVAQTNQSGGVYAVGNTYSSSSGTFDARTLSLRGDGIISIAATNSGFRISASQSVQTQSLFSAGLSNLGNTLGDTGITGTRLVLVGTDNITLSQSTDANGATVRISGQSPAGGAFSGGVSTGGNTAGATGISGTQMVLVGSGVMSLSQTTGANGNTVSILAPPSSLISAVAPLSTSTNGSTISILGPAQFSGGFSTQGNTAGNTGFVTGRLALVGSNNITLSGSTDAGSQTISIIGGGGGGFSAGVSTGGNTAGATGISGTQMVLVGSGAMSLSQTTGANGNTVSILGPAVSVLSAVAPLSTSTNGSTISILGPVVPTLVGTNGISVSTAGNTISIGNNDRYADWQNMPRAQASLISHVSAFSKTPFYWNDHIDGNLTAKSLAFAISMVTASQPLSVSAHIGVYTLVNSTSAALLGSVSEAYVVSSASSVSLSGVRNIMMTGIGTHTALSVLTGGEYLLGMMFSATATQVMNFSLLGASGGAGPLGGIYPGTNQLTTGTSQGIQALHGRGSTTVNAMPANVSQADLINQGTAGSMALHPWIYIRS